ncbi:membrane protein insertase YidC [Aquicoccus porphyridii]|uniref:Membrane protein insertase YidC n=1 Tax=Aquicoccus porphyridii TaxID=1852029 RepID=A0A5A9YY83_9RHOB|nr:membrane protein insertase YidC [Aquicoccus porphyridii]KAA0909767.1 membrane protein insertase YidC [Aquicoccus porphyridii]RAI52876.1 membrane protein insertase YidC [Rhodobacteraceae bacterium AsT-22]
MDDQNKNLILAVVLSMLVIIGWAIMFPPPEPPQEQTTGETAIQGTDAPVAGAPTADAPAGDVANTTGATGTIGDLADAPRITIDTPNLQGSISLLGGRIDQLSLKGYRESLDEGADIVSLLSPFGSDNAFYALYGWAPGTGLGLDAVPGPTTLWTLESGQTLTPQSPIQLSWANDAGLTFHREIAIDEKFMFTVTQSVENTGGSTVALAPYGVLARHGEPEDMKNFFILHEGIVGFADGQLTETDYDDVTDYAFDPAEGARAEVTRVQESGWIGFTDHYWMATLIPDGGNAFKSVVKYDERRNIYQTETVQNTRQLAPGERVDVQSRLFAGAKEWATIRAYENEDGVVKFLDSIDWGWFFFLTKPIFALLHWLNGAIGNMGWAIIGLTLVIKLVLFPLAYKSYASMAKMRELQPQMEKLKEQCGDDRQKMQQEMMALYKREKVNPASGCLPILLQIPIFFSLYKVIFVTLELRHAPWIGWIRDLSAPDPSSLMNLFGLMPWGTPEPGSILALVFIGVMPIALGVSMWLQQKLNPAPTDATQKMIFAWMPWVFMFMLGSFASGLVLYWIANNTITFIQQYTIMRSHGYKPDLFGNIRSSFSRGAKSGDK